MPPNGRLIVVSPNRSVNVTLLVSVNILLLVVSPNELLFEVSANRALFVVSAKGLLFGNPTDGPLLDVPTADVSGRLPYIQLGSSDVSVKLPVFSTGFKLGSSFHSDIRLSIDDVVAELSTTLGMFADVVKGSTKIIFSDNRVP